MFASTRALTAGTSSTTRPCEENSDAPIRFTRIGEHLS